MIRRVCFLFALLCVFAAPVAAQENETQIESFRLGNGLEVIVIPNHRVPAISHMLWYPIGGADDPQGKSGLAHFHEHMMFQGTTTHDKGEYADIIARHGGKQNAFTGPDATAYYVTIPKQHLSMVMELEADRIQNLSPNKNDALKERDVILEERRERVDNNPEALFYEQLDAVLYYHHPYGTPLIGWKHEIEALSFEDVMALHREQYHIGNAILVISGDVTAAEVKPLAERYYGALPVRETYQRQWMKEPLQLAARQISMTHPNQKHPLFARIYHAPSLAFGESKHAMPLLVLEHLLGGGKASRLYQSLVVEQKLAVSVNVGYQPMKVGPAEFRLAARPANGVSLEQLEAAIDKEITRFLNSPVTDSELSRAKTLQKASTVYAREGIQSMGYVIGWLRISGHPVSMYHDWPDLIDAVSAADVKAAAAHVFDPEHSVSGMLLPEAGEGDDDAS